MQLVGRGDALDTVERALRSVTGGASIALCVSGEPGIGKSKLLRAVADRAAAAGCRVLTGRAAEFERDTPFMAFVDALDDHLAELDPRGVPPGTGALLSTVFPSVTPPAEAPPQVTAAERFRVHRALRAVLNALAEPTPVVLLLDDVHWLDDASVELLAHLLTYPPTGRVLVAMAHRPAVLDARLRSVVDRVRREERLVAVELPPLSRAQARELVGDLPSGRLDELYTQSGGNPFYLLELARDDQAFRGHGGRRQSGVPASVVAAINHEIAALPPDARRFAHGAAVAGEAFDPDVAATAAGLSGSAALDLVDALVAGGLLVPGEAPRRFRFRHPVVRRAVYDAAGAGQRIAMHRRLAAALRERGASAVELAHHVEVAAEPGDEAAVEVLTAAGHAVAGTAPAIAAGRFAAALRLLARDEGDRRVDLLVRLAAARRATGDLRACREALLDALASAPDVPQRVRLTALCGAVETDLGMTAQAHGRLRRVLADVPEGHTAELLVELAVNAYQRGDWADELRYAVAAHAVAFKAGTRHLEAMALVMQATAEFGHRCFDRAVRALDTAARLADDLTDDELAARPDLTAYLARAEFFVERFTAAVRHADRGLGVCRTTSQAQWFHVHLQARIIPLMMLGRLEEALESARETEASARLLGVDQTLMEALMRVAHTALAVGDLTAAIAAGEEGAALARDLPPIETGAVLSWALAQALLDSGQLDRAAIIHLGPDGPTAIASLPNGNCCAWELAARIEAARGCPDQAWQWVERIERTAQDVRGPGFPRYWAQRARAHVLLHTGDPQGAARAALKALAVVGPESRYEASCARLLAGQALAAAGDREEAVAMLERARTEFDEHGAVRLRDEAAHELRKLGLRVSRSGRRHQGEDGLDLLSGREREIAELVAGGRTNREIGQALLISTRTVERHLSHIFTKLHVSTRTEVGVALHRLAGARG